MNVESGIVGVCIIDVVSNIIQHWKEFIEHVKKELSARC